MTRRLVCLALVFSLASACLKKSEAPASQVKDAETAPAPAAPAASPARAGGLTCAAVLGQSEDAFVGDWFTTVQSDFPAAGDYRTKLLRKSVAAFHGNLTSATSDQDADEMGEGVAFAQVRGKDGRLYQSVNVGFGGGNSATYYYADGTLDFVPIMSYDGECIAQGEQPEFPLEQEIGGTEKFQTTCQLTGTTPFKTLKLSTRLAAGQVYVGHPVYLTPRDKSPVGPALTFQMPYYKKDSSPSASLRNGRSALGGSFQMKGKNAEFDWTISVSARLNGNALSLGGRVFPETVGGFWHSQAVEVQASGTCDKTLAFSKILYTRKIKY